MNQEFQYRKVAEEYVAKYPKAATRTIARMLATHEAKIGLDVEQWRWHVRHLRGAAGKPHREKHIKAHGFVYPNDKKIDPTRLPKSYAEVREPHVVRHTSDRILVISDVHIPYHDTAALSAALNYGLTHEANCVIINGDLIDFHKISKFQSDPRKRDVVEEFNATYEFLVYLRELFPAAEIIWTEGNHDARYPKWLLANALPIFNDPYFHLEQRLKLDELGITFVRENRLVSVGKLTISHGHMITRGIFAPVNAARGVFLRTKASHLVGHSHQVSEHTEPTIRGELITTWSTGCLCELRPDYDPHVSKAAHGFAFITTDERGHYKVRNYRINNGEVL